MAFKQTKGNVTVEACVFPAPGQMFEGALRVTTAWRHKQIHQVIGRRCGRPTGSYAQALALAEAEARRMLRI
ncbi:hypothetical protein F6X40_06005 [Paraburkholderia sp. UCT31]|uniref:hypothetical protein n=1 Tax=Paraburkholderia sp. UCT31 TaxID=2615209 RepID=UPI001655F6C5|nr:hypothetical protein [Paraburkholderia sp. UCT31]MBC8736389.1 hypothetical protein [Paraburkholderia sp. UCT31]